jgi:hypothetical protein
MNEVASIILIVAYLAFFIWLISDEIRKRIKRKHSKA